MRLAVLVAVLAAAGPAAAEDDALDTAREQIRSLDTTLAEEGIRILVNVDSAAAVRVLREELIACEGHLERADAAWKREENAADSIRKSQQRITERELALLRARKTGTAAWKRLRKQSRKLHERLVEQQGKVDAARGKFEELEYIVHHGLNAFRRFGSRDARAVVLELAGDADSKPIQGSCVEALGHRATEGGMEVLRPLAGGKDPVLRCIAIRALAGYAAQEGVAELAAEQFGDKLWPVRRAAYEAVAAAPRGKAVPLLVGARETEPGALTPFLDLLLHRLTGKAFPDAAAWKAWWEEHAAEVSADGFRPDPGAEPPPPTLSCFGVPVRSKRVLFALMPGWSSKRRAETEGEYHEMARETLRALDAMPGDAEFNIRVGSGTFSKRFEPASDSNRKKARAWLERFDVVGESQLLPWIEVALAGRESPRKFERLAETVVLVVATGRDREEEDSPLFEEADRYLTRLQLANLHVGMTVHAVSIGGHYHRDLLAGLALETGGALFTSEFRFPARLPLPREDRIGVPRTLREAYRDLRGKIVDHQLEALRELAKLGGPAVRLLGAIVPMLDERHDGKIRVAALEALAAIGPGARSASGKVKACQGDPSEAVQAAAKAALGKLSG